MGQKNQWVRTWSWDPSLRPHPHSRPRCYPGRAERAETTALAGALYPQPSTHLAQAPSPHFVFWSSGRTAGPATGPRWARHHVASPRSPLTPAGAPEAGVRAQRFKLAAVGGPRPAPRPRAAPLQPLGVNDVPEVRADGGRQEHEAQRPCQSRRARQHAQVHPHGAARPSARGSQLLLRSLRTGSCPALRSSSPPSRPSSAPSPSPAPSDLHALLPNRSQPSDATATLRPHTCDPPPTSDPH